MAKLTKAQAKAHAEACAILGNDRLNDDEREFVIRNWQESASHINSIAGAFFTPLDLALDFTVEIQGRRIVDLCAGIGCLSLAAYWRAGFGNPREIVCIEKNPDYVAVGRKVLPEAKWICADVFELRALDLGRFDCAISNPPFGSTPRDARGPRYTGRAFEYHVIDLASDIADYGAFIVPQSSAPFAYSGERHYREAESDSYRTFRESTGIELLPNCGIDTSLHLGSWRGVAPKTEIVIAEFTRPEAVAADANIPPQLDLFGEAA
jgi:predicted RNA methylase